MLKVRMVMTSLVVLGLSASAWAGPKQTSTHKRAAEELMEALQMDKMLDKSVGVMLDLQFQQAPQLLEKKAVVVAFFRKYMSWNALRDDLVSLYVVSFTERELRDLTAFYKTPTGQKAISVMPTLMQEGAKLGQQRVQEHMPELVQALQATGP